MTKNDIFSKRVIVSFIAFIMLASALGISIHLLIAKPGVTPGFAVTAMENAIDNLQKIQSVHINGQMDMTMSMRLFGTDAQSLETTTKYSTDIVDSVETTQMKLEADVSAYGETARAEMVVDNANIHVKQEDGSYKLFTQDELYNSLDYTTQAIWYQRLQRGTLINQLGITSINDIKFKYINEEEIDNTKVYKYSFEVNNEALLSAFNLAIEDLALNYQQLGLNVTTADIVIVPGSYSGYIWISLEQNQVIKTEISSDGLSINVGTFVTIDLDKLYFDMQFSQINSDLNIEIPE